jgi:hypothetical protein
MLTLDKITTLQFINCEVVKCMYKLVITLYISLLRNNKMDNLPRFHKYNSPERYHYYFKTKILMSGFSQKHCNKDISS